MFAQGYVAGMRAESLETFDALERVFVEGTQALKARKAYEDDEGEDEDGDEE